MSIAHEQRQQSSPLVIQTYFTQVLIIGDLCLSVTESEAAQAQAGQRWIYPVQVQVTDQRTSIVTGVFVQILVTADNIPQVSAAA